MRPTESLWIQENVLPSMTGADFREKTDMVLDILKFIGEDTPEFWGYMSDYDYVVLCSLFGGMEWWPKGWPYLFYDLRQALDFLGLLSVKQDDGAPHNALDDARWIAQTFKRWQPALGPAELTA